MLGRITAPSIEASDREVRLAGAVAALVGGCVVMFFFAAVLISHRPTSTPGYMTGVVFLAGLLYGTGLHRLFWGNPNKRRFMFARGVASVLATLFSISVLSLLLGFMMRMR